MTDDPQKDDLNDEDSGAVEPDARAERTKQALEANADLEAKINKEFEPTLNDGLDDDEGPEGTPG